MKIKRIFKLVLTTIFALSLGVVVGCNKKSENPDYAVTLDKETANILQYEELPLNATLEGGLTGDIVWKSSDENVATVQDGVVYGVAEGQATITATVKQYSATCAVTVSENGDLPRIVLSDTFVELLEGGELTVEAQTTFRGETVEAPITYTSNNPSIAVVENGKIKALSGGTAIITVKAEYLGMVCYEQIEVVVKMDLLLNFEEKEVEVYTKASFEEKSTYAIVSILRNENQIVTSGVEYTFVSSDPTIASVSDTGVITGLKYGNAQIEVTATYQGTSLKEIVEVNVLIGEVFVDEKRTVEIYANISEQTLVTGYTEIDLSDFEIANVNEVNVVGQDGEIIPVAEEHYTIESKVFKMKNAPVFEGGRFGEYTLGISTDEVLLAQKLNVVTKVINNRADFQNMYYYGNPTSSKMYSGYFVLGADIDMANQEFLVGGSADNRSTATHYTHYDIMNTGFKGVFDGLGHKIYNAYFENGTGLFGNVMKESVVKNFALVGTIKGAKSNNLAAFLQIRVLGQRFAGTLQNAYISLVPDRAGSVYVPLLAQGIASATIIDCVIKYDASNMTVRNNPKTTWPAAVALAYFAYADTSTLAASPSRKHLNPVDDIFAPSFSNVYFVTTPPKAVGDGVLDKVYVDYELYATEGEGKNGLGRFINTAFGEYGHPQKSDVEYEPTGLTHKDYNEEFTATFTDNTYWEAVNGQPVFKSLNVAYSVSMGTVTYSKYSSLNGTTPVANTDGLEISVSVAPEAVSIDGVALTSSDYTYASGKVIVAKSYVSALALGEHTLIVKNGRNDYTSKLIVATKVIMNRQDLQDMYYYGNPDSSLKYTGYFVLGADIDMNNQEFLVGGNASNVNANTYYTWDVNTGFAGTFDGLGHKLYNFYVAYGSTGLFGHVTLQGVAKNFAIVGKIKGAKTSNLAAFLNIRVLAQRFSGTLQNAYISLVPESAGDVYVPMIAQAIAKATIIDCVIKYDASGMAVRNSSATTWPAAVALAYYAYPDPGTLKGAGRTNVNPINDDYAPEFINVYFVVTPPAAVGTGKLDRVYVGYELYSTEGADNALGRFINTAFGNYGHASKTDATWAPTGLTHKGYTEEFTATFTDNTYWNLEGTQPVFKGV